MSNIIEIKFPKLNHFWLDSGLLGLTIMLSEIDTDIEKIIGDTGLTLKGPENAIQSALEKAYDLLIKRYYNLSSRRQQDDITSYNFYYNSKKDKFVAFPKKKTVGIARLMYDKAPRPTGYSVKWKKKEKREITINGKPMIRNRGILPTSHSNLQKKMDAFLDKNGLDVTTSGLLVDGENEIKPKVKIKVKQGTIKGICYLCGKTSHSLEEIKQTTFPFITGSSGMLNFFPLCGKPEKVCWKCAFLGKFVPVNGFYLSQRDNLLKSFLLFFILSMINFYGTKKGQKKMCWNFGNK